MSLWLSFNLMSTLLLPLLSAPVGALVLACRPRASRAQAATMAGLSLGLALAWTLWMVAPAVYGGEVVRAFWPWVPHIGLDLSLRVDGLSLVFMLLILGIGLLVVLYGAYYLADDEPFARFYAYLLLFAGAMLGLVMAGNLLLLVVFWELTSLVSFLLIGYWRAEADARRGARMAFAITGAGGLCLLAGALLLGHIVGSYELDHVLAAGPQVVADAWYPVALVLILLGAFTKSAQFPLHFWLPHAMAAPTPVSAYLHSATMVKAGVFLLARLYPTLAGDELWFYIVTTVGMSTLLFGAIVAIFQHDLKGLLAYSTVSHLGLITLLLGLSTDLAVVAAVFHIINHATFKASLFMAAGIIDHETGSRDMRQLNGLAKYMPFTAALAMVGALAMAGVPLLNGFLSKEMFFVEAVEVGHEYFGIVVPLVAVLAGICSVAYSLRFIHDVFFNGEPRNLSKLPEEPPRFMKVPVEVLVVICLAVGMFPATLIGPTLKIAAASALQGPLPAYKLALWHGFNLPLLMSVIALVGGAVLYLLLQRVFGLHEVVTRAVGKSLFEFHLDRLFRGSDGFTQTLESGRLQRYMLWLWLSVLLIAAFAPLASLLMQPDLPTTQVALTPAPALGWILFLTVLAGIAGLLWNSVERLNALIYVGLIGLCISVGFVLLSAPDLALTQLLVEFVSIVLFLLVLKFLPLRAGSDGTGLSRARDALLAIAVGLVIGGLAYAVLQWPAQSISGYYLATTVPEAGGTNAVNTIIVDYRALDTLGEITVYAIAALVIAGLLVDRAYLGREPVGLAEERHPLLLRLAGELLLPLALTTGIYLLLRGHNEPGGGFIGGLVVAIGYLLQYIGAGYKSARRAFGLDPVRLVGVGLLLATLTGVASLPLGFPFMTSYYEYLAVPVIGKIPLSSAFVFDLGVFLVVHAGTVLALGELGRVRLAARP